MPASLYPFIFKPVFQERVWGGRRLASLYHKELPPEVRIGESWEIADRPEGTNIIINRPLAGKDLRWLMENHGQEVMGTAASSNGRFPLLVKILDSEEKLSLQVHPPKTVANRLGGEPKTEMWYITHAEQGAELYAGLKAGVTTAEFERKIQDGSVAECFHRLAVKTGDAMFLPSGRVHAVGAGMVLFEIQQNSDTTYRVYDWNRVGKNGQPRELHVAQALASIDFSDFEPTLITSKFSRNMNIKMRYLVNAPTFMVDAFEIRRHQRYYLRCPTPQVIGVLTGRLQIAGGGEEVVLNAGQFCLIPASVERVTLIAQTKVAYLQAQPHGSS